MYKSKYQHQNGLKERENRTGGASSIPDWGPKSPCAAQCG